MFVLKRNMQVLRATTICQVWPLAAECNLFFVGGATVFSQMGEKLRLKSCDLPGHGASCDRHRGKL